MKTFVARLFPLTSLAGLVSAVAIGCSLSPAEEPARSDGEAVTEGDHPLPPRPSPGEDPVHPPTPPSNTTTPPPSSPTTATSEPAYCEPSVFATKEVKITAAGIANLHAYKLGTVTLAGLAVGDSETTAVQSLAKKQAPTVTAAEKSCTFYYNDGNADAETAFNWYYVPKPSGTGYAAMVAQYSKVLGDVFDTKPTSILSCASKHQYVAMGCNGMHHRGPTVFAATLAYSGCSPEHAVAIVDKVWGANGILPEMRIEIAKWAAKLGTEHPQQSAKLRELFGGQP
jgi:hypothetical protein